MTTSEVLRNSSQFTFAFGNLTMKKKKGLKDWFIEGRTTKTVYFSIQIASSKKSWFENNTKLPLKNDICVSLLHYI